MLAIVRCPEQKVILPFLHWKLISCQRAQSDGTGQAMEPRMLVSVHKVAPGRVCVPGDTGLPEGRTAGSPSEPSTSCCWMMEHLGEKGLAPEDRGAGGHCIQQAEWTHVWGWEEIRKTGTFLSISDC